MLGVAACSQAIPIDSHPLDANLMEKCLQQKAHQSVSSADSLRIADSCLAEVRDQYEAYGLRSDTEIRRAAFINQQTHGSNILVFVIVMTAAGVVLAAVQLLLAYLLARSGGASIKTDNAIKLATNSIYVRSSVAGVAIIAISFGFFFLYIRYVYPLSELRGAGNASAVFAAGERRIEGVGKIIDDPGIPASSTSSASSADVAEGHGIAGPAKGDPHSHRQPLRAHKVRRHCAG
ncbi:hypothetical protein [Paraburkholderia tropica]|uniref:hypothetical protein n=1 Tax=Paraburkholderia tropica TaxID=92647 RepID=UPI002AAF4667|nr:hypothetical protein [Paraburkholderia tropica]